MRKYSFLLIIPFLFAFNSNVVIAFKTVKLHGIRFKFPVAWQEVHNGIFTEMINGKDTLFFTKNNPDLLMLPVRLIFMDCIDRNDTNCQNENRKVLLYNDSLERANPEMRLYNETTFYAANRKWGCTGWLPSGNERVPVAMSFYGLHKFKTVLCVSSSPMNAGEAIRVKDILATAH